MLFLAPHRLFMMKMKHYRNENIMNEELPTCPALYKLVFVGISIN